MTTDVTTLLSKAISGLDGAAAKPAVNGAAVAKAVSANDAAVANDATTPAVTDTNVMQSAAQQIQSYLSGQTDPPAFSVDYLSGLQVMTVRSASSGDVLFQLPNADALRLAQLLKDGVPVDTIGIVDANA